MTRKPTIVVEDDVWLRLIGVVLDPATSEERRAAFADFMSPDLGDLRSWCEAVRKAAGSLFPSNVKLVRTQNELRESIDAAAAIVVESLQVGADELVSAKVLRAVYKYGMLFR